jgi:peptidoglycan hydrolase CwlO-like protein
LYGTLHRCRIVIMEKFLASLREHWFIIALIFGGGVAWTTNTMQVAYSQDKIAETEKKVAKVEEKVENVEQDVSDINAALVRIDTNQQHIQRSVEEIKSLLRDVAKAVEAND